MPDDVQTEEVDFETLDGERGAEVRWRLQEGGAPLLGITVHEEPLDIIVSKGDEQTLVTHLAVGRSGGDDG